jgi:hypothetical protein
MAKKAKKPAKTKAPKAMPAPKTKRSAPGAAAVQDASPGVGHNSEDTRTEDEVREGFLQHREEWNRWMAKAKVLEKLEKEVKANLKAEGYTVKQMQIADQLLGSPQAEAKVQGEVTDRLQVAQWVGHPMGAQMDLFAQPDRTPAVDRARDAGKQASMESRPRKAPHSPETEQAAAWYAGYDAHQHDLHKGFKKTKPDGNGNGSKEPAADVTSGEHVTRSEFKERMSTMTAQEADGSPKMH